MSTTPKLPPKIIQNRHILALVEVPLWVKRQPKAHKNHLITLPLAIDRLHANPRLEHLFAPRQSIDTPAQPSLTSVSEYTDDSPKPSDVPKSIASESILNQHEPNHNPAKRVKGVHESIQLAKPIEPTKPTEQDKPVKPVISVHETPSADSSYGQAETKFFLQGVRFGRWVLMVDMLTMSRDEQSLWQSLKNALSSQSVLQSITCFYREIHYPLIKNEFRLDAALNPAQYTFDGFVIGMSMSENTSQLVQVVFLTDTPTGIHTHITNATPSAQLPTIGQMLQDKSLKKTLWQQVLS